jgi:methylglutaconyl-CoA hydratase
MLKKELDKRGVYYLTLDRPSKRNALNPELIKELTEIFTVLEKKNDVRLVVLSGSGKACWSGRDIDIWKNYGEVSEDKNSEEAMDLAMMYKVMNESSIPIISKVNGATLGGGVGLIAVSDFVLSSSHTKIGMPEVCLGLIPAVISPYVISKIGESYARAYFLSGMLFDAQEAWRMGLIHQITDLEELDREAESLITRFLKAGPQAARKAKVLINTLATPIGVKKIEYTCEIIAKTRVSAEAKEGMSAVLEKRSPSWVNDV